MIEAGHFAAFLALAFSAAQTGLGLHGARDGAGLFAKLAFLAMAFAFVTLIWAFVRSDFSVELVAAHSHTLKPLAYKIAGTWGNHEGSMALWCLVGIGFGAAGAILLKTGKPVFEARALGTQGALNFASLAYLLFASSPFTRLADAPLQGSGLNPLLQDPALAIHPPM
ncbi:MAG: heme lyase CcmF/NrfE family subunit, partial [Henriciella sp.]